MPVAVDEFLRNDDPGAVTADLQHIAPVDRTHVGVAADACFPSVRNTGMTEHEFCERLLREERVAVILGSAFGYGGAGHTRCAYAASLEKIEKASERMYRFMQRHG